MRSSALDPARLDVAAFCRTQATLKGHTPLTALQRLTEDTLAPADGPPGEVAWSAHGLWRQPAGAAPEMRLHLRADVTVWQTCQRCLLPVAEPLVLDRTLRFVAGEDEAARLDEEDEEDVLALPRALDLDELIEDELILALPLVPRHEVCPVPVVLSVGDLDASVDAVGDGRGTLASAAPPHPFAALARLKRGDPDPDPDPESQAG